MKNYKLSIPKPCNENWNAMISAEKGRFCSSCEKTVVDFTQKSSEEIQYYLTNNKKQRVCGHFYRKQLDTVVIQLPNYTIQQKYSFHKVFIVCLLLTMGTSLLSCKTDTGKIQKIEKVEFVDSIQKVTTTPAIKKDTVIPLKISRQINLPPPPTITGIIIETTGEIVLETKEPYTMVQVDVPPKFPNTPKGNKVFLEQEFDQRIKEFIKNNFTFKSTKNLGLSSNKYKMLARLIINTQGIIEKLQIKAPHKILKIELEKTIAKLPQFEAALKDDKKVSITYVVPVIFTVE